MKTAARRALGAVAGIVREINEAQHLMMVVRTSVDGYIPNSDKPPETYGEFLSRTSGVLRREPSARERERGSRRNG